MYPHTSLGAMSEEYKRGGSGSELDEIPRERVCEHNKLQSHNQLKTW